MTSLESYQLKYDLFLAEQELFDNMIYYGSGIVNESVGLISVNEGVKETIMDYLKKISDAIQKAWERFKEIVLRSVDAVFLKKIGGKVANIGDPGFTIQNYRNYDMVKLNSIKLMQFNYEEMKQSLETKEAFIAKYYGSIIKGKESIVDQIENYTVSKKEDKQCTKDMVQSMYKFVSSDFKTYLNNIETDLRTVNTSNANIERIVKTITPVDINNESVLIYESYITEEEAVKFKDDPNRDTGDNSKLVNHVTTYVKVSTEILSAKLKILKDAYGQSMKTLRHVFGNKKEKSDNKFEEWEEIEI